MTTFSSKILLTIYLILNYVLVSCQLIVTRGKGFTIEKRLSNFLVGKSVVHFFYSLWAPVPGFYEKAG